MDGLDSRLLISPESDGSTFTMVQGLNQWSSPYERELIDTAAWPDDVDHKRYGPLNSTGSGSGFYYPDDTNGQGVFRSAIVDKTKPYVKYLRDGAAGHEQQVLVSSFGVSVGRSGVAEVSIGVEGTEDRTAVSGESPTVPALTDAQDGLDARVYKSGTSTSFSDEACTEVSGTVFQITDDTKRVWDRTASITVEVSTDGGSTWTENTSNTIDRLFGTITFDSTQTGNMVRVSGNYLDMTASVAEAYEYDWELARAITDKSAFDDDHNKKGYGPLSLSGSVNLYYDSSADFESDVNGKTILVLEFQQEQSADMRCWVVFGGDEESSERSGTVGESISFEGAADADRRMVSFGP